MNIKNQATDLEENQKLFTSNGIIIYNSEKKKIADTFDWENCFILLIPHHFRNIV